MVVRGWLDFGFEKRHLLQHEDSKSGGDDNICTSVEIAKRLHARATRLNHRYVIVTGTFRSDLARGDLFLGLCNFAGIQVDAIVPSH